MHAPEWLVEVQAHTGSTAETLRFSSSGYTTKPTDTPPNTYFDERIIDPGYFETNLFADGRTLGRSDISAGEVILANVDGELDDFLSYGFDGRRITIKRLSDRWASYSSAVIVFSGTVEAPDSRDNARTKIRLRIYDRRVDLDQSIQTNRYPGTVIGTSDSIDGAADLKDTVRPLCFGRNFKIPAVRCNPFDLIYQVNDGAVASITVYDAGVGLTNDGDEASLAALRAATVSPGKYRTCLALGIFMLGGSPHKIITADVDEGALPSDRTPAQVVIRMLSKAGFLGADLAAASFTALDLIASEEVGTFIGSDVNALPAIQEVLSGVGGYIVPNQLGEFTVGRLSAPGIGVTIFTDDEVIDGSLRIVTSPDDGNGLPAHKVILRYRRQWHEHSDGDLVDLLSDVAKDGLSKQWLETIAEDPAVKAVHLLASEMTIDTLLIDSTAADAEVARRLVLYKTRRDVIEFKCSFTDGEPATPGISITMAYDRFDYQAGRDMVVLGRLDNYRDNEVTLTVWG